MLPTRFVLGFLSLLVFGTQLTGCGAASAEKSAAAYPTSPQLAAREESGASFDSDAVVSAGDMAPAPPNAAPAPAPGAPEGYGFSGQVGQQAPAASQGAPGGPTPANAAHGEQTTPDAASASGHEKRAPLLIYDAVLTLAVFEAAQAIDTIEKLAVESGGYLVQRGDHHITIRVPSKAFRPALDKVETLGDELHRQVNVRDVTEEFSDLEIRLQNARAVRARLEELLRQATTVEDALAVQKELERVTEEIERMLGRLKLLRELVAFSTITVRFEARPSDVVENRVTLPFPWLHELGLPRLLSM
jgi:hypothetical protein